MVSTVAQHRRTTAFSPPWISPACQRSFRIPAGYLTRSCPRAHAGWNVPLLDQRKPHHLDGYAHLHTGLASDQRGSPPGCISQATCSRSGRGTHDCGSSVLLCHQPVPSLLYHVAKRRTSPSCTRVLFYSNGIVLSRDWVCRWWALSPGACLPLSNGDNCRLLFAGRAGGTHGPDVRDAVLCFTSGSFAATCAASQDSVGDVEIHIRTSDWFAHQHHTDVRYNNVILHIVAICDDTRPTLRQDGTAIPTCSLYDLPHITPQPVKWPCHHVMVQMNEEQQARLFRLAGMLRFEQKMHAFLALLRDAQPSGCFSAHDVCLIPALAEGLEYGRDRAFFRAAGLHLLGLPNTIPEPLGRAPEPSPQGACQQQGLHFIYAQTCREKHCSQCIIGSKPGI